MCPHEVYEEDTFGNFFFLNLFGKRTKFCRPNANNFQQSVQTAFYVTWEQFEEAFSLKNSWFCFSIVFWHLVTIFRSFAESFSWPLSEPLFDFPKELFEKIVHRKLFFLLHNERKILAFHRKKFSRIPRNGILGVQRPNLEKNVFLFWKKTVFFQCFCTSVKTAPSSVEKISGLLSKMHCACPWKQFAEENFFVRKYFFY